MTDSDLLSGLRRVFDKAVESVAPAPAVVRHLPTAPKGKCVVVGAGKAAAAMAAAVDAAWPDTDLSGVVSTRYAHAVPAGRIRVLEAGHPVPDEASELAAHEILAAVDGLSPDDLVIALISGGGSATMALPVDGLTLAQKQQITRQLLNSGAGISEINTVRTQLSRIKGGKLAAAAAPARLLTLIISDVPGDDPAIVASGPTIRSDSTPADALCVLNRYGIDIPAAVHDRLESAEPRERIAYRGEHRIVASPSQALEAAAEEARKCGFAVVNLGDRIEGESKAIARDMATMARSVREQGEPAHAPAVLISGGETSVTIGKEGAGRGGRNTEFLLALAVELDGEPGIYGLAGDSDGIDGTEDAAGAIITPDTLSRAAAAGFDPVGVLTRHDSYTLFQQLDDLVITGPTLTNVNDIRIVAVT